MSWRTTAFTRVSRARLPIVAAPLAGGPTTPALVAAASEAGAFGVLAAGYLTVEELRRQILQVRARTAAPFGVNVLLSGHVEVDELDVDAARRALQSFADELGVAVGPPDPEPGGPDELRRQLEVVLEEGVRFLSFTFGCLDADSLGLLHEAGVTTCGTATSVAEARALVAAGIDMVCAQGAEAGGHRGGFLPSTPPEGVATAALVPLVRDAVDVPLIAAGGLVDGRGVAAALALGADAAQLGTAFLLSPEAGTSGPYRAAVRSAAETDTVITTAVSGKPARGLANRITRELAGLRPPAYPVMNSMTRPLRRAAAEAGTAQVLSLWAGQAVPAARELPAGELVAGLEREVDEVIDRLASS